MTFLSAEEGVEGGEEEELEDDEAVTLRMWSGQSFGMHMTHPPAHIAYNNRL